MHAYTCLHPQNTLLDTSLGPPVDFRTAEILHGIDEEAHSKVLETYLRDFGP